MLKKIVFSLVLFIIISYANPVVCQVNDQHKTDSIILTALKDELYRNLNGLSDKEAGKPFFISYSYLDGQLTAATAILGTLSFSEQSKVTDTDMRLMMGDYNLNDENFEDNYSNNNSRTASLSRQLPIEPDYRGIRNALWWNTSELFRSAAKNYNSKLAALKDKPIVSEEEQLPDYTQAPPVKINRQGSIIPMKKSDLELYVKEISTVFKEYKEVYISYVSASVFSSTVYIINSEGSEIRIPMNIALVDLSANVYTEKGEILSKSLSFTSPLFSELPPIDTIKSASRFLANHLLKLKKAEIINENYTGPVLFLDDGVANVFSSCLFGYENPLIADRDPLVNSLSKSMTAKNKTSRESKLGKKIISKDITVKSKPHLKEFKGIPLMGSFEVDAECIVPPDEITLIEKGILKTMYCDRIPTRNFKQSNGHNRIGIRYNGISKDLMPGVLFVESEKQKEIAELKQQMIDIAIDKGLEYVIIVRPMLSRPGISPLIFYKLDVNTLKEELIYNMSFSDIELKTLNKIAGCGTGTYVQNLVFDGSNMENSTGRAGFPTSFIVPDALLIEEMELTPSFPFSDTDLPFYENPEEEIYEDVE